jgi:hypothetical protein
VTTRTSVEVVDLCVPTDWAELLLPDAGDAGACFDQLVRRSWPNGPAELWSGGTAVLTAWRDTALARGAVSHGVISASLPDGTPARWQVVAGVVDLPPQPDVDVTAVLGELIRAHESDLHHVETFPTDMGLGVGMIGHREVRPSAGLPGVPALGIAVGHDPIRMGTAAALACAPGAVRGLLVVGVCLAPEQVLELAALVAVMAGRSRIRPTPTEDDTKDTGR